MWEKFKQDFKERFLNFETAKGMYLIPAGLIGCYVSIYHVEYVIQAIGLLFSWYAVSEGLRKVWVNRVKQESKRAMMVEARLAESKVA